MMVLGSPPSSYIEYGTTIGNHGTPVNKSIKHPDSSCLITFMAAWLKFLQPATTIITIRKSGSNMLRLLPGHEPVPYLRGVEV